MAAAAPASLNAGEHERDMDNEPSSTTGLINRGAVAFNEGRLADARALFARALLANPESEAAWLWFATVAEDPAEQRYALNRALAINPESTGLNRLVLLPPGPATIPADLIELDEPPLPPDLARVSNVRLLALPRPAVERQHRARAARSRRAEVAAAEPAAVTRGGAQPWLPWLLAALAIVAIVAIAFVYQRQSAGPSGEPYVVAYAGPLSGPDAFVGEEQRNAVGLAVDTLNDEGGIGGRPLEIVSYDDANDPARAAQIAGDIVANERVLLVIGHDSSDASMAAAPVYEAAGLPAITPSSTADALTANDPWYFRSIFTNHDEGEIIAAYSRDALGHDRASVISTAGEYESSLASAFVDRFGQDGRIVAQWTIDPANLEASVATIVDELQGQVQATDDPGLVLLALRPPEARALLLALGRAGVTVPMIGGEAIGYGDFADLFEDEPEELAEPGFFTNGLYAASPMIYDSLGGDALAFAQRYREVYGSSPEWFGAKAYGAASLAIHAIGQTQVASAEDAPADLAAARTAIRDALAAIDSVENAVPGLSGPLYFDATRSVPPSLSFGLFDLGTLLSAPLQYRAVDDADRFDLATDEAAGLTFEVNDQIYRQYRVAYVGVDINEISNLNAQAQTFNADFFLWFRYLGDKSAENVFFSNAADPTQALPDALDRSEDQGENFAIFRVDTTFTEPMNFQNFPWDEHLLSIDLQNVSLSQDDIVYVPDQANLRQPQEERLRSGIDFTQSFNRIPSWIVERVFYAQDSAVTRSTTPNPRTGAPEYDLASTYQVQMSYARDVRSFLIKNLLPLALLALVTYISLFFSPENASTRIGFSITAILTTSVLLQSVAGNLPDIGYTVAIEWGYYVYIGLSALLVLINITIDRWYKAKRFAAVRQLDRFARILYPAVLLAVLAVYAVRFA
jgi:ABC-type branched-subunit amino acid transport system substrate-binding protein